MGETNQSDSARCYVEEVSRILCDLPTPSINAAVMRGAGVRLSLPDEGMPGPRRVVLDDREGRPLATGITAAALLTRQRANLAYLAAQRDQLANRELRETEAMPAHDAFNRNDHAFEVMDCLRVTPLLTRTDFIGVFGKLAILAGLEQSDEAWEIDTNSDTLSRMPLSSLGSSFSIEALETATKASAARFHRWRRALHNVEISSSGDASPAISLNSGAATDAGSAGASVAPHPSSSDVRSEDGAALRHHHRSLSDDALRERRRRFPELFIGVAFASPEVDVATKVNRRRRFPELYTAHTSADTLEAGGAYEMG